MKYLYTVLLSTLIGCQTLPTKINNPYPQLGMPLAQARIDNQAGDKPKVAQDLNNIEVAAKEISAKYVDCEQMRAEDDDYINKHKNDWTGARTQRWAKWIIFLGIPLFSVLGAILTYSGGLPAFAHFVIGILSGGVHFIHLMFIWLINKIKAIRATKANAIILKAQVNKEA